MRETWKEIGEVKHKLIVSNTLLVAMIAEIKKEREKIASYGRKINVLIEKVELIEQQGENK